MNKKIIIVFVTLFSLISLMFIVNFFDHKSKINVEEYLSQNFNDQIGIQKAIDQAEEQHIPVVYFPKGKYVVNSPILVGSKITLKFDEGAVIYRNFSGGGSNNATIRNKNQRANGNTDITIEGGTIRAVNKQATGKHLAFWGVRNLTVDNVKFRETYGDWTTIFRKTKDVRLNKIDIDTKTGQLYTDGIHFVGGSNINITNSKVISGDDAIAFTIENKHDDAIKNVNVSNCRLITKRASVIKMMTTINSKGTISNIKFENISGIGGMLGAGQAIFLDDRSNSRRIQDISLNSVKIDAANGAGYGAQINGVSNISIKDSEVSNSEGTGLVLQNSKNVKLKSTKIIKPRSANSNGISIENTKNISMHDVTIDSPKLYGIYINNKLGNVKNVKVSRLVVKGINKANIAVYEEDGLEEHNKVLKFSHDQ